MEEFKGIFDVIFLSDKELNIDSGHDGDRPCLIVGINNNTGEGYVVPLSSKFRSYGRDQHQLAFGSYIDLTNRPITITETQLRWANKSDFYVDSEDCEILEERFQKWIDME